MARARLLEHSKLLLECPGCGFAHCVSVLPGGDRSWTWSGSVDKPTLSPSILVQYDWGENREKRVCHSFVVDGAWQYLGDCTHALAGQLVELPDIRVLCL